MKSKSPAYPPAYNIESDQIKAIVNAKDRRTIIKRLQSAGVTINKFGDQQVVLYDDIISAIKANNRKERYIYKGNHTLDEKTP